MIVVIGPGTPTRDELDQPLADPAPKRVGRLKQGSLDDLSGLAQDLGALAGELADTWQIERPDDVRAHAFADADGKVLAVFVLSDAAVARTAILLVPSNVRLRDPFSGEGLVPAKTGVVHHGDLRGNGGTEKAKSKKQLGCHEADQNS